ncbi:MAG: response regulator transcription factor [Gammaproteobacteria bacterium]|nr:response regulator transcription factor [Gammaproteobacteria bacterium]
MIRLALVDDHQLVRDGLKALLSAVSDFEVVGEASDGRQAVELARKTDVDVIILDIAMSGLNGLEAAKRITANDSDARIIILSMHDNEEYIVRAVQNGVRGYLVKSAVPDELENAIRVVVNGGVYFSPEIGDQMRRQLLRGDPMTHALDVLSSRQREILQAIAEGRKTREIADELSISPKTVETHRSHLMQKLNIHDVPGLVRYAIKQGLVSVD